MLLRSFRTSTDDVVVAGVCAGIARDLGVDATLVRLIFALLALAGGAGIIVYLALWAWSRKQPWWALVLLVAAGSALLGAVGLPGRAVLGIALVAAGVALLLPERGSFRPGPPPAYGGSGAPGPGA